MKIIKTPINVHAHCRKKNSVTLTIGVMKVHKLKVEKNDFFLSTKIKFDEKSNIRNGRELQKDKQSTCFNSNKRGGKTFSMLHARVCPR